MIDISMSSLGNKELYTLGVRVNELIVDYDAAALGIQHYADKFMAGFQAYETSIQKETASAKKLSEKDVLRDNYYKALRNHVHNFRFHPVEDVVEKSKALVEILDMEGKVIYSESYKLETAALRAIIAKIDKDALPLVFELGGTMWYEFLKKAQKDFEETVEELSKEQAKSDKIATATENRPGMIDGIQKLFSFLPLHHEITEDEELGKLIDELQKVADRFK